MPTIVIDPGHGGSQPVGNPPSSPNNATGPQGTKEKDLILDIGLKCRDILRRQGVTLVMTRETDSKVQNLEIDEIIFDAGGVTLQLRNRWNYDQGVRHDYDTGTLGEHSNHIHFAVTS